MKYKIIKKCFVPWDKYYRWIEYFLYLIPPSVYDDCDSEDECKARLKQILELSDKKKVRVHQTYIPLSNFKKVVLLDDRLEVLSSKGSVCISFKIEKK